jgi:hypothetical protein
MSSSFEIFFPDASGLLTRINRGSLATTQMTGAASFFKQGIAAIAGPGRRTKGQQA